MEKYLEMEHKFMEYCEAIKTNGILLDISSAEELINHLTREIQEIDDQLLPLVPKTKKTLPPLKAVYKKNGEITENAKKSIELYEYKVVNNQIMDRWLYMEPNLNSSTTIRDYLLSLGWIPSEDNSAWNFKKIKDNYGKLRMVRDGEGGYIRTSPKLPTDDNELGALSSISPAFKLVADRIARSHRLHVIEGFLKNVNKDTSRISMGINSCGATTGRVTHYVVANLPRVKKYFGKEMRSLFVASEGNVIVGCDAAQLEARYLAHYLDSHSFTNFIINNDIHDFFYNLLEKFVAERDDAKSIEYAFIYGAGDAKLGSLCNLRDDVDKKKLGKEVRKILTRGIPNLDKLLDKLYHFYDHYGAIPGIDGRIIRVRSKHAILNTLLQSAGGIHMKWVAVRNYQYLIKTFGKQEIKPIIFYHDELEYEVSPNIALQVGQSIVNSIEEVSNYFKLNCPITGKFQIGKNWSEVH